MKSINVEIGTLVLSDGSAVFSVGITNENGQYTSLDCWDEKSALKMQADIVKTIKTNGV